MIVKGKPRSGPAQLAAYLMRSDEQATLIELWDGSDDLHKAFLEWHAVGEASRGEKTLYHAQIAPEARYQMTPEQWKQAAAILAEELGMKDHPRAIVVHQGDNQPHAHVVFQRANSDTLTLWDDGFNYVKHERASLRMAKEFGMEIVPGKHAKRDRKKQPEFPRAAATHDDHQQAARTEMTLDERKAQITALRQSCDDAKAFKAALEEAGYVLAKGDRRGFVLVDRQGETFSLSKHVTDIKSKEYKSFMAGIDPANLPTVDEAKAAQEQRQTVSKWESPAEPEKQGVEASKFLQPQPAEQQPEPIQAQEDAELEAIKKALAARQAKELEKWADLHAHELRQCEHEMDVLTVGKTADFDALLQQQRDALNARHTDDRSGIKGIIAAIQNRWNPQLGAERAQQRRREIVQLQRRLEKERKDYLVLLEQNRQLEIENLKERQAQRLRDQQTKHTKEEERYIRDHEKAKSVLADIEAREQELEKNESLREGPPPPKLGK